MWPLTTYQLIRQHWVIYQIMQLFRIEGKQWLLFWCLGYLVLFRSMVMYSIGSNNDVQSILYSYYQPDSILDYLNLWFVMTLSDQELPLPKNTPIHGTLLFYDCFRPLSIYKSEKSSKKYKFTLFKQLWRYHNMYISI